MKLWFYLFVTAAALPSLAGDFPAPRNSEADTKTQLISPEESARKIQLPPGFKIQVAAAEPAVQNPIAVTWDARGRLWVAENYTYAESPTRFDMKARDRIIILEDKDGDGKFETRKVFTDDVQMLTSVEVGHGGVWAMCPPQVLFIPDRNGDDIPDGAPEAVLEGFTPPPENYHNYANGLRFGPDGWLYGRCGASSPGEISIAGAPAEQRIPMRGTMWRYHPRHKIVEVLSGGTTNPWGHDWNEYGELFFINTVNGHLWHGIAGAHFVRPHTIDPNPRVYGLIDQHADHWHFDTKKAWSDSRDGVANSYGGGHAHVGMMIYLGDNWPQQYRGHLFTLNMHGRRANQEILEREGSGYVGRHGQDMFITDDVWFRGMEMTYGPDGSVMLVDWTDIGECHERTGVHRTSGRIFKLTYGDVKRPEFGDLSKLSSRELVKYQTHANEWYVRQARLELAARVNSGGDLKGAKEQLREIFDRDTNPVHKLRALWSLHVIGATDASFLQAQLNHSNEYVRAWAIRLLTELWPIDTVMSERPVGLKEKGTAAIISELARLARNEKSALVRLTLASTLQRLPVDRRTDLASALVAHSEDASDHNIPDMIWYGLIPAADAVPKALASVAAKCELPATRQYIARRLAEDIEKNPAPLNDLLASTGKKPEAFQSDVLKGISQALTGWRKAKKPASWDSLAGVFAKANDTSIRDRARDLSVVFGDGRALDDVKKVALDKDADIGARKAALQTLIDSRPPELRQMCEQLLSVRFLNPVAARGLATFDDPAVGKQLVNAYSKFHHSERPQLLATLVSRVSFATALLEAVATKKMPRTDISAYHARQIRSLNDAPLNKLLAQVWGELRDSEAEKKMLIDKLKKQFTTDTLTKADKGNGRVVFNTACAACHTLYGQGGAVGPDLTGAGRDNIDYLLENLIDPSAVVTADFRMTVVNMKDGRVLNGLVSAKTERTLTLKTMTETLTLERTEVENMQESALSLMPEGLVESLSPAHARDLFAYLMHRSQVPLPASGGQ